tara:strand:- start:2579 stop:3166 length:588 start_codon:yes stop_codon:yes gene_type:complete
LLFSESHIKLSKEAGYIEVICGSMFSGKTEELLRRIKRAEFAKLNTKIFKPSVDIRYCAKDIVSHNKRSIKSIIINNPQEIFEHVTDDTDLVAIDEAQFFDESLVYICNELANKGLRVIIAGLDMDFQGNPFGSIPQLLAIAEHVTKVNAICIDCGENASFSFRKSEETDQIKIGEKEEYAPLCRSCFLKKNNTH